MLTDLRTLEVTLCNISSRKKMAFSGVRLSNVEIEQAKRASFRKFLHIPRLKEEKHFCLRWVAKKSDVFGILPTDLKFNTNLSTIAEEIESLLKLHEREN